MFTRPYPKGTVVPFTIPDTVSQPSHSTPDRGHLDDQYSSEYFDTLYDYVNLFRYRSYN